MKLVRNVYDFIVEHQKDTENRKVKAGSIFRVAGFTTFEVFLIPPFEIDAECTPLGFRPSLGIGMNPQVFSDFFEQLTEEEISALKIE